MDPINTSTPRSRQNSATATPKLSKELPLPLSTPHSPKSHYTVFIRLPFPRNDFQDPPPVEWDAIKDKALWKLISTASNSKELNWEEMSTRFNVSLPFLLQQAAWLYERHFDAMRAQMKKLNVASANASGTATPAPAAEGGVKVDGGVAVGGVAMSRGGSKDSNRRSFINTPRSPLPYGEQDSVPGTPRSSRLATSRNPSTTTVTQTRFLASPRKPTRPLSGIQAELQPRELPRESPQEDNKKSKTQHDESSESESEEEEEEDEEASIVRSHAFRKPPFSKQPTTQTLTSDGEAEDDEEGSSGGYLPFAASAKPSKDDPAATIRTSPRKQNTAPHPASLGKGNPKEKQQQDAPDSSASSASSAHPTTAHKNRINTDVNNRSNPLSVQRRAELEKLSPRYKKPGSDDSPSMGSSFSDLDDVTQSALEDALMSNMQHGSLGMGSRMASLKDASGR